MHVVSVINYKGGVGKTTVTANLGAELAHRGHKVLLLHMDPQCSLTFSFVEPDVWDKTLKDTKTIKAWFDSFNDDETSILLESLITKPPRVAKRLSDDSVLDLIPSHLGLINVDLELATELGGASMQQVRRKYLKVHRRLADGLNELADHGYDLVPSSYRLPAEFQYYHQECDCCKR